MIIGVNGKARSGKDTFANTVEEWAGPSDVAIISLSDPGKRFLMEAFGFSEEQLWGDKRDWPDPRYPLNEAAVRKGETHLTTRRALQTMLESLRDLHNRTWLRLALEAAQRLLSKEHGFGFDYIRTEGVKRSGWRTSPKRVVFITDLRNELDIREMNRLGHYLVRVKRDGSGLKGEAGQHSSETSMDGVEDDLFDAVVLNKELDLYKRSSLSTFFLLENLHKQRMEAAE